MEEKIQTCQEVKGSALISQVGWVEARNPTFTKILDWWCWVSL